MQESPWQQGQDGQSADRQSPEKNHPCSATNTPTQTHTESWHALPCTYSSVRVTPCTSLFSPQLSHAPASRRSGTQRLCCVQGQACSHRQLAEVNWIFIHSEYSFTRQTTIHAHTHTNVILKSPACFWSVGGSVSTWRKPTQAQGEQTNSHRKASADIWTGNLLLLTLMPLFKVKLNGKFNLGSYSHVLFSFISLH